MRLHINILVGLVFLCLSCQSSPEYKSLTYHEMVDAISMQQISMAKDVAYLDIDGSLLNKEQVRARSKDMQYALWLVNTDNVLVKVQLRDPEKARLSNKKESLLKDDIASIDCKNLSRLLERIYHRDQENRKDNLMDPSIDEQNLDVVEKIITKCGLPSPDTSGEQGMDAIWLVLQHASKEKRKQYFPMLLEASKKGHLDRQSIALMQDRMLMDDGKEQLYGSQVTLDTDGNYELYQLKDPETVDARRAIMGLQPLSEYVKHFNIIFDTPQIQP